MLELEVIPEYGITSDSIHFILGTHFSTAIAYIQNQVGTIKGVEISYCDKEPLAYDLSIKLTRDGIKLIFDSISQRLKIIEIYDLSLVRLKYCDLLFNCPDVSPTIEQIDQSFGATRPGVYDPEKQNFTLTFRGLAFEFPAETSFQPSYGGSKRELGKLQFPPGESPSVSNLTIYSGNSQADCTAPALPPSHLPTLVCKAVHVIRSGKRTCGLSLTMEPSGDIRSSFNQRTEAVIRKVGFGDSVQDVMSAIGAPSRVFYKSEDKMKIHSPNAHRKAAALRSDYFFNYFLMGLDILFDARSQTVKKFILHTNFPGHYNFNMYHRCEFNLNLEGSSAGNLGSQPVNITPISKWEAVSMVVGPCERPVVLNRASSTNTTNPFGSTFCYGIQDIIFEVMPNGHLASLSLYLPQGANPLPLGEEEMVELQPLPQGANPLPLGEEEMVELQPLPQGANPLSLEEEEMVELQPLIQGVNPLSLKWEEMVELIPVAKGVHLLPLRSEEIVELQPLSQGVTPSPGGGRTLSLSTCETTSYYCLKKPSTPKEGGAGYSGNLYPLILGGGTLACPEGVGIYAIHHHMNS